MDKEVLHWHCIFRPHRSATYVDAVNRYQPSSVVSLSVSHAVWVEDSGGPREPCIRWGVDSPMERDNFEGEEASHCKL